MLGPVTAHPQAARTVGCFVNTPFLWLSRSPASCAPAPWMTGCTTSWTEQITTNGHVMPIWNDEFEGIHGLGGLFVLTMHSQIIGRPGRLRLLGTMVKRLQHAANLPGSASAWPRGSVPS